VNTRTHSTLNFAFNRCHGWEAANIGVESLFMGEDNLEEQTKKISNYSDGCRNFLVGNPQINSEAGGIG
jgi:hypothetical protein